MQGGGRQKKRAGYVDILCLRVFILEVLCVHVEFLIVLILAKISFKYVLSRKIGENRSCDLSSQSLGQSKT